MREIVLQNHGRPGHEMSLQVIGPRDRIIASGLIPASAFPADDTFREGRLPNGVDYEVERLGGGVWDVWLNLPPDPWLGWMASEMEAKALADIWRRMLREAERVQCCRPRARPLPAGGRRNSILGHRSTAPIPGDWLGRQVDARARSPKDSEN